MICSLDEGLVFRPNKRLESRSPRQQNDTSNSADLASTVAFDISITSVFVDLFDS